MADIGGRLLLLQAIKALGKPVGVGPLGFGQRLKPLGQFGKAFITRRLGHARIHLRILVCFAFNGRLQIGLGIPDRHTGRGITDFLQKVQMSEGMACFRLGRVAEQSTDVGWTGLWPILYMAVFVSIVSHGLWYMLLHRYPINVTTPFALLTPVFGVLFGILILDEIFTWFTLAGGLIALAGVAIITVRRPAQALPPPER